MTTVSLDDILQKKANKVMLFASEIIRGGERDEEIPMHCVQFHLRGG